MVHLDTSYLIRALVPGTAQDRQLRDWLRRYERLAISSIAWTEFLCGPIHADQIEATARIVPQRIGFEEADARLAARLLNETGRRRGSLTDCMIAASALATVNRADFLRFEASGLSLTQEVHPMLGVRDPGQG
ncbi:MAG: type II toxin-antitoxin system VapC family toxin [Planctomycetota bacterium]